MDHKEFTVNPGQYKGLHYTTAKVSVSDAEVEQILAQERSKHAKMVEVGKAAQRGDTVVIDYAGFCDGEQFPGGTSNQPYPLVLGSNSFIPGFEDQLIGAVAGEERDVNVTFPAVYHEPKLAGKPAVFKCKVHAVQQKEIPALGDSFAKEFYGFDTLEELRNAIREDVEGQKKQGEMNQAVNMLIGQIVGSSEITLSDEFMQESIEQMRQYISGQLAQQGASIEMFAQSRGMSMDEFEAQLKEQAENNGKVVAVLTTIAETEGLSVSDEEIEAEIDRMAAGYGIDPAQLREMTGPEQREQMAKGMLTTKAVDFILANAVED